MKSPELYTILKVPLQVFCERQKKDKKYKNKNGESKTKKVEVHNFQKDVQLSNKDYEDYLIKMPAELKMQLSPKNTNQLPRTELL